MPSVLQIVFSTVAAGLGIVFNGYILFVLLLNRKIQTANRVLLLHMAFVDTVFCLVILLYNTTLSAVASSSGVMPYNLGPLPKDLSPAASSYGLCEAHGFMWTLLPVVVVWTICGLSCDRYAAISTPLHYSRVVNTKKAFIFVIASWLGGATLATPPLLGVCPYTFWDARWACAATCTTATTIDLGYAVTYVVMAIVLPVAIILVCNLHILIIAKYHRHRIVSAIYEVTLRAQATVTHQRNPCYLSKFKGRSAFFTISQVVGTLVVLTVPYYSVLVWEAAHGKAGNAIFVSITTILLTCIPPVNAYVYGVKSRVLRQTLKRLLHRHLYPEECEGMSKRFSEIFSESRRPPLIRRVSAPAGYCRKISGSSYHSQSLPSTSGERSNLRNPFIRSSSLPTTNDPCCSISFDPTPEKSDSFPCEGKSDNAATFSSAGHEICNRPRKHGRILLRGMSVPCGVPELEFQLTECDPENGICKAGVRHQKKMAFERRSSSLPETAETLKEVDEIFSSTTCNSLTSFAAPNMVNSSSIRKEKYEGDVSSSMSHTNQQSTLLVSDL